jgi:hypothetical protein
MKSERKTGNNNNEKGVLIEGNVSEKTAELMSDGYNASQASQAFLETREALQTPSDDACHVS